MQSPNVISRLPLRPQVTHISPSPDLRRLPDARPPDHRRLLPTRSSRSLFSHKKSPNRCTRSLQMQLTDMSLLSENGYACYSSYGGGGLDASLWPLLMESHGHPNVATPPMQGPLSDDSLTFPSVAATKCLPSLNLLYSHQHLHSYRSAVYATVLPTQTISTKEICEDESRSVIVDNGEKIHGSEFPFGLEKYSHGPLVPSIFPNDGNTETQIYSPYGKDLQLPKKRQLHKRKNEAPETSMPVTVAVPGSPSMRHTPQSNPNSGEYNKQHRARITEGMRVLQEIIAPVKKLRREAVLEAAIDHAKKLKLQIEVMSHSKGGDGGKSDVFAGTEGCSVHLVNEQTTKEPLEATLAKLIECDMKSACSYLNSRGLALVPMAAIAHLPDY